MKKLTFLLSLIASQCFAAQGYWQNQNVEISGGLYAVGSWNNWAFSDGVQPALTSVTLDAASEGVQWIMQASKTCSIQKITIATATVTTGATMDVGVYTVSATTGLSSGTLWNNPTDTTTGTMTIADANDNTFVTSGNLTATADVVVGDVFVIQLANPAASFGNMNINYSSGGQGSGFAYSANNTGGSYAKVANAPNVGVLCADGTAMVIPGTFPGIALASPVITSATTPDEIGIRCTFDRYLKVAGIRTWLYTSGFGNGDIALKLYDGNDVVLASRTLDKDIYGATNRPADFLWANGDVYLAPGKVYRLTMEPVDATNYILGGIQVTSSAYNVQAGNGGQCYKTSRADDGAWTDDATILPSLWFLAR